MAEKGPRFLDWLISLLKSLDIPIHDVKAVEILDNDGNPEVLIKEIGGMKDLHENYVDGKKVDARVDVFYGDKKSFVCIHIPESAKKVLARFLLETTKLEQGKPQDPTILTNEVDGL